MWNSVCLSVRSMHLPISQDSLKSSGTNLQFSALCSSSNAWVTTSTSWLAGNATAQPASLILWLQKELKACVCTQWLHHSPNHLARLDWPNNQSLGTAAYIQLTQVALWKGQLFARWAEHYFWLPAQAVSGTGLDLPLNNSTQDQRQNEFIVLCKKVCKESGERKNCGDVWHKAAEPSQLAWAALGRGVGPRRQCGEQSGGWALRAGREKERGECMQRKGLVFRSAATWECPSWSAAATSGAGTTRCSVGWRRLGGEAEHISWQLGRAPPTIAGTGRAGQTPLTRSVTMGPCSAWPRQQTGRPELSGSPLFGKT